MKEFRWGKSHDFIVFRLSEKTRGKGVEFSVTKQLLGKCCNQQNIRSGKLLINVGLANNLSLFHDKVDIKTFTALILSSGARAGNDHQTGCGHLEQRSFDKPRPHSELGVLMCVQIRDCGLKPGADKRLQLTHLAPPKTQPRHSLARVNSWGVITL